MEKNSCIYSNLLNRNDISTLLVNDRYLCIFKHCCENDEKHFVEFEKDPNAKRRCSREFVNVFDKQTGVEMNGMIQLNDDYDAMVDRYTATLYRKDHTAKNWTTCENIVHFKIN